LLGLSLFLPWYTATAGSYAGEAALTGWSAFDRTDRVLVSLGLLIVLTAAFAPARPLTCLGSRSARRRCPPSSVS